VRRTYTFVLGNRFLHETNVSTYPPQDRNKAGEVHQHWGFISHDRARGRLVMRQFHLIDSHLSLILPNLVTAFGTFLLKQFFETIPVSLEEAAKIDGCMPGSIFLRIAIPLTGLAFGVYFLEHNEILRWL
jgi:hypothetical protein